MKTQPCLCAVDVECTVRVQSRKLLIETIMLWLGGQPHSPPGVGESKTGDNKGTFLPRSPWLLIFLLWDRVVVAYTLYVWHPSLPSHLWQIFLVWKIPQQKHKFTPLPNSVPQLPPTTKAPPPPFFFSAKPGSMHRKQLSLTSACLLVARCILGTERCVTVDMWLTLYKVPLL